MKSKSLSLATLLLFPLILSTAAAERPSAARIMSDQTLAYVRVADSQEFGEKILPDVFR